MNNSTKFILVIVAVILVVIVGSVLMNTPDDRPMNERIGAAISKMDPRELEDRTPAERLGDAVQDATQ